MKFNSQICTTREQSERLLKLGLKKETADMAYLWYGRAEDDTPLLMDKPSIVYQGIMTTHDLPAWSLARLVEMMPSLIWHREYQYSLNINDDGVIYDRMGIAIVEFIDDNLFDNMIACIRWLIEKNHFNKEYLV